VLLLLLCLGGAGVLAASPAAAAQHTGLCDPDAPIPDPPGAGMPGFFMDPGTLAKPLTIVGPDKRPAVDQFSLYNDSGFSGLGSNAYDMGCSQNPSNWGKTISAMSDTSFANKAVSVGYSATALADAADRAAWSPTWIKEILGFFTSKAMGIMKDRIVVPFIGVGLLAASVLLITQSRKGNVAAVTGGVAWAIFVVVIAVFLLAGPLKIAQTTQGVGASGISTLYDSSYGQSDSRPPYRDTTETVMHSVHYQGWLRRTFGNPQSETAKYYGPSLLAASRITHAEYVKMNPGRTVGGKRLSEDEQKKAREERKTILAEKAENYNEIASAIKDSDPTAYRYLQGASSTASGSGMVEMGFALVSAFFRVATDMLLILCVIVLLMLGIAWVIGAPFIVTSYGEGLGRSLMNNTGRAVTFVLLAALGSWIFNLWTQVAFMPGLPAWWSAILLIAGTVILWSLIRPDRKALNLVTMGQMHGHSKSMKRIIALAGGSFLGAKAGAIYESAKGRASAEKEALKGEMRTNPEDAERARNYRLGHHTADPYAAPPAVDYDPYVLTGSPRSVETTRPASASTVPVFVPPEYQRPANVPDPGAPQPPPAGASGQEEIYTVTDMKPAEEKP
jgi:hypothetical protein